MTHVAADASFGDIHYLNSAWNSAMADDAGLYDAFLHDLAPSGHILHLDWKLARCHFRRTRHYSGRRQRSSKHLPGNQYLKNLKI